MAPTEHPILVISYGDDVRKGLVSSLEKMGVASVPCSNFLEAEDLALCQLFSGILVDLPTMIKSKGEEKIVACSLTGFYPTLRVRVIGAMLIPMTMPGGAKQDNSLNDFIARSCAAFRPRTLRMHRRFDVSVPVILKYAEIEERSLITDISWGGVFVLNMHPERFNSGEKISLRFHDIDLEVEAVICRISRWGARCNPGMGLKFIYLDAAAEELLFPLIRHQKGHDKDRLVA